MGDVGADYWRHRGRVKGNWVPGGIISAAMMTNLIVAGIAGVSIPILLKKMNIDPALAGGMALTTVTDVIGLSVFLGWPPF